MVTRKCVDTDISRQVLRSPPRAGFTLVELMVVIGIVTFLAAILVTAIGSMGVKAKIEATAATIRKVSNQVQERLEAFDRLKTQPQWTKDAQTKVTFYARQNPPLVVTLDQAKALLLKDRMKMSFPQSFNEYAVVDPVEFIRMLDPQYTLGLTIPSLPNQLDYTPWSTAHPTHRIETESSAILYYVLTSGKTLGIPTVNPDDYRASEVADTDGDGLMEFVDAWGKPLRFYRWPTRLFCPTGSVGTIDRTTNASWMTLFKGLPAAATPDPLTKDQDDPTLTLIDPNGNTFSTISQLFNEQNYHTLRTYHDFLLVSSGPDGQKTAASNDAFGLWPPTDQYVFDSGNQKYIFNTGTSYGYLAQPKSGQYVNLTDNITNRNR